MSKFTVLTKALGFATALLFITGYHTNALANDPPAEDPHAAVFSETNYPLASECAKCHQTIYDEWRSSNHAYASISPMFHKFEQKINDLAPTIGNFCVRCHAQVGTQLGEQREAPLWERSEISREGITCITCHRVEEAYGKVNGERHIVPGEIYDPVYGTSDGSGLQAIVDNSKAYNVKLNAKDGRGKPIHNKVITFSNLSESEFCVSCHQVAVNLGIKLEVVWDQYRASPAKKDGVSCQDCHMSDNPGVPSGFEEKASAVIAGKEFNPTRKHHNHAFAGPGYPIAHPGIFPHNNEKRGVLKKRTIEDWLEFDYIAGWGTPRFERKVKKGEIDIDFPKAWDKASTRKAAAKMIKDNLAKLEEKRELRKQVMENGSKIDGPFFDKEPAAGKALKFAYKITNKNAGHNLPSGSLGAQPELWLNVALINPAGDTVWESGYVDSNGDMADLHSLDVLEGKLPIDHQLFNLQTKFLTTNVKGTEREMYLPVNMDIDQIPFLRPAAQPTTVMNHPPFVRMEGRSIPPLGSKMAKYKVPAELVSEPGTYKLAVRMRSRAEPIYFMRFVGSTPEMEREMNKWMLDIHPYTVEFEVQ